MAMGINTEPASSEGFMGYVQFDAKAGRAFRPDRSQDSSGNWTTDKVEITNTFTAVMDFENLQVGWIAYPAASAPIMHLVPLGQPFPAKPEGDKFKQGFQMVLKLGKDCGGDLRTFSHTAKAVLGPIDELHDRYVREKADHPGQLPVVKLVTTKPITSGSGDKKSTSYTPVFDIIRWVDRPADLGGAASAKQEEAPAPKPAPAPAAASDDDEEF